MSNLQEIRDRGQKYKRDYLISKCLSLPDVCVLLDKSKEEIINLRLSFKLITLQTSCPHTFLYPKLQFIEKDYIKGLDIVKKYFLTTWDLIMFLDSGDYYLSGKKPIDVLKESDLESVLIAADNYGEQRAL